jgi:arabinogalactan endo-1,4-beta-galactosidase
VRVTAADGLSKKIAVYVTPKKLGVKKLRISGYKTKMKVGAVRQIKVRVSPARATGLAVTYRSSNPSGLYVDKAGKIVALKKGKYTVTVRAGGKKVKTKRITVR